MTAYRRVFVGFLLGLFAVVCCGGIKGNLPCGWAQSGSAQPDKTQSRVLSYVPARGGHKAHVVFVPPSRDFKSHKNFLLQTPRGEVVVHCEPFHPGNPDKTWASEISYPLNESLYYFRSPSLPIYLFHPYEGFAVGGGSSLHEVRVNGKTVYGGGKSNLPGSDGKPVYGTHEDGIQRSAPIVLNGKWNKLALIVCDSGGE